MVECYRFDDMLGEFRSGKELVIPVVYPRPERWQDRPEGTLYLIDFDFKTKSRAAQSATHFQAVPEEGEQKKSSFADFSFHSSKVTPLLLSVIHLFSHHSFNRSRTSFPAMS